MVQKHILHEHVTGEERKGFEESLWRFRTSIQSRNFKEAQIMIGLVISGKPFQGDILNHTYFCRGTDGVDTVADVFMQLGNADIENKALLTEFIQILFNLKKRLLDINQ